MTTFLPSTLVSPFRLRFGRELWPLPQFAGQSRLTQDERAEVAVIGAGTTGAFVAYDLLRRGIPTIIVDRAVPASGSTRACTALIQHELDTPLYSLAEKIGETSSDYVGKSCLEAVRSIRDLALTLGGSIACHSRPSLYLAATSNDIEDLKNEYNFRQKFGFATKWYSSEALRSKYPFQRDAALYNEDGVELDPVALTHAILARVVDMGGKVFSPANVVGIRDDSSSTELSLADGVRIICKKVIVAAGYETKRWIRGKVGKLTSTYAAATGPNISIDKWDDSSLVWETARPYLYMRRTDDGRIIVGGRDKQFRNTFLRDVLLPFEKYRLEAQLREILHRDDLQLERGWCGTFSESDDGMPYMGATKGQPNVFYIFASGGNGVTFAALAPTLVRNWMENKDGRLNRLFSLHR